ncbi:MAG: undecaprenyl-diphosphatase [Acidimicrobiaceae bacterium]|nr:undecaprenyl-diphosphatase [Acidimicrobiaceae bacterium]
MPILHAIVLGITQGLSEFLPVSSSGHLILVPWLFKWTELTRHPDLNKTFDVALHIGTFVGAIAYFRLELLRLLAAALRTVRRRRIETPDERLAWLLLLSAVPGALTGAALESVIEEHLGKPWLIGIMLIVFGLVLGASDRLAERREMGEFGLRDAVLMGVAQAAALQPGVSRSGVTISAGRALGYTRDAAARISFLMSLPIIGGAGLYKALDVAGGSGIPAGFGPAFAWGFVASAVTGFAAVWLLLRYVRTHSFAPFVAYRVAVGVVVLVIAALR